jgi:hypothetical protein
LGEIVRLGQRFPAALDALRERRDKAEKIFLSGEKEHDATSTFASINYHLKEPQRNIDALDRLPAGDRRRTRLALSTYDELVARRRYADAVGGRSVASINEQFDRNVLERPLPAGISNPERIRKSQRDFLIKTTAKDVETLAGSGNTEPARALANKLLNLDGSPETQALLRQHLERAGQPNILRTP